MTSTLQQAFTGEERRKRSAKECASLPRKADISGSKGGVASETPVLPPPYHQLLSNGSASALHNTLSFYTSKPLVTFFVHHTYTTSHLGTSNHHLSVNPRTSCSSNWPYWPSPPVKPPRQRVTTGMVSRLLGWTLAPTPIVSGHKVVSDCRRLRIQLQWSCVRRSSRYSSRYRRRRVCASLPVWSMATKVCLFSLLI